MKNRCGGARGICGLWEVLFGLQGVQLPFLGGSALHPRAAKLPAELCLLLLRVVGRLSSEEVEGAAFREQG